MKINIQNISEQPVTFTEQIKAEFLDKNIRACYPNTLKAVAKIDKFGRDLKIELSAEGVAIYRCDSCLSEYEKDISFSLKQIFQVGAGKLSGSEGVIELDGNSTQINLTPFLREMVLLNHPIKMRCKDDCKGLCSGCGVNLNEEECKCGDAPIDPKWAELRKLIK